MNIKTASLSLKHIAIMLACLIWCIYSSDMTHAQSLEPEDDIVVVFFPETATTFELLSEGGVGSGYLLYYLPQRDRQQPSLAVHLSKSDRESNAVAHVYQAPHGANYVPVDIVDNQVNLASDAVPTILITALGGWWIQDGVVNYNLDIQVNGPVIANWAGDLILQTVTIPSTEPLVEITVRDETGDGIPDWDLRRLIPRFPQYGFLRANYAERKCYTPATINLGITPLWPFVAYSGTYEQEVGELRPPIVVDWDQAKITYFSEIVTVRNQNCSYSFYSIVPLQLAVVNELNFETPFAFYDFSNQGHGYPNAIVRSAHFPANDPTQPNQLQDVDMIRYSWRTDVGDQLWDYKLGLLDSRGYDEMTAIAAETAFITAPDYEQLPNWIVQHPWPIVTFVDTEAMNYRSSEGVYTWDIAQWAIDYVLGGTDKPLDIYDTIQRGLRGEYYLHSSQPPTLYFSSIDNRLHLLGAEGGLWNLDDDTYLHLHNLSRGQYIDTWIRTQKSQTENTEKTEVEHVQIEALYVLEDHFLYVTPQYSEVGHVNFVHAVFEIAPPTNKASWQAFREQVGQYEDQKRDPTNIHGWLDAFPGPRMEMVGVSIANVRFLNDGFRFELTLTPDYQINDEDLLGVAGLTAGNYLVVNRHSEFTVAPLVPAAPGLDIQQMDGSEGMTTVQIKVQNTGTADAADLTLIAERLVQSGEYEPFHQLSVDALAEETELVLLDIPATTTALRVRLEDSTGQTVALATMDNVKNISMSQSGVFSIMQVPVVVPVLLLFAGFVAVAGLLTTSAFSRNS